MRIGGGFKLGDRVVLDVYAINWRPKRPGVAGTVVGGSADGKGVTVVWDGNSATTRQRYAAVFLERAASDQGGR